jgi:hypothetical protein
MYRPGAFIQPISPQKRPTPGIFSLVEEIQADDLEFAIERLDVWRRSPSVQDRLRDRQEGKQQRRRGRFDEESDDPPVLGEATTALKVSRKSSRSSSRKDSRSGSRKDSRSGSRKDSRKVSRKAPEMLRWDKIRVQMRTKTL